MSGQVSIPRLVKGIRRARGLTQEQLARELQVTFSTVNCWENGKHQPIPALASRLLAMARESGIQPAARSPGRGTGKRRRA